MTVSSSSIRAFQTGIDKIDLRALTGATVTWVQQSDADGLYSLVTVSSPTGTMQLRVEGPVAIGDFLLPYNLIQGGVDPETLIGTPGNDDMRGDAGADLLLALEGADLLDGGAGADRMEGGPGDDIYYVDSLDDQVIETAGNGDDRIITSIDLTLGDVDVETLEAAAGSAPIVLTGNAAAQTLIGNNGANVLNGGGGADVLRGLGGERHLYRRSMPPIRCSRTWARAMTSSTPWSATS